MSKPTPTPEAIFEAAFNAGAFFALTRERLPNADEILLRRDEMLNDPARWVLTDAEGHPQPLVDNRPAWDRPKAPYGDALLTPEERASLIAAVNGSLGDGD